MKFQRTALLIRSDALGWDELRQILVSLPEIQVIGDVSDRSESHRLVIACVPDVIIAAPVIDDVSSLTFLADLHHRYCPAAKIILFAHHYVPLPAGAIADAGIVGYLLWSDLSGSLLRHALKLLIGGEFVLGSRSIANSFVEGVRHPILPALAAPALTVRERAVLDHLAAGFTHEQTARAEGLSMRTVERVIAALEHKLNAPNQFILAKRAVEMGLLR